MSHVVTSYHTGSISNEDFNELYKTIAEMGLKGWEVKGISSVASPTTQGNYQVWNPRHYAILQRPCNWCDENTQPFTFPE